MFTDNMTLVYTGIIFLHQFIVLCRYSFFLYKLKVFEPSALSKISSTIFPRATAHFMSPCLSVSANSHNISNIFIIVRFVIMVQGFPSRVVVKNTPANAGDIRDVGSIPGSGRSPRGGNGNPLQYSCLENPMGKRTKEPGGLQSIESQRVRHNGSDLTHMQWSMISDLTAK